MSTPQPTTDPATPVGVLPGRMRVAVVINWIAPYMRPFWDRLSERSDIEVLLVTETPMERDRRWGVETDLPVQHVQLDSWTLNLASLTVGSGYRTRFDTYVYLPRRPLAPLRRFGPDVVVAAGGGVWSSPANVAVLAARRHYGWAVVPWWNSFSRERASLPRRMAEPWVRYFFRSGDAWLAGGTRHARDLIRLGTDPDRTVIAPITALAPDPPLERAGPLVPGNTRYLFVGRFIERKGIDLLLDAFRDVEGGELWLAGDGPVRTLVEQEAREDPRVRYLGYAKEDSLSELYRNVDVLVAPSLFEPWGLVVHEALAHGLPVITTDQVGAADDLVDSGVNGYIVPAGSKPALAQAMRSIATWGPSEWLEATARTKHNLPRCGLDRSTEAFVQACRLGLRHRRGRLTQRTTS